MGIFDRLRSILPPMSAEAAHPPGAHSQDELHLAAAVLLVEAASMDAEIHEAERTRIGALLSERFGLGADEAQELLEAAERTAADSAHWQGHTRVVKERFDQAERIQMLEMLWEVVYTDGRLHDHEASLLRRITGLLYVTDRESGEARKRVLARLGLQG
jgi:uncharacterized tellurite resistance protein B-like protein